MNFFSWLKRVDWWLMLSSVILGLFGLVGLYSFTFGLEEGVLSSFWKQFIALLVSLALFYYISGKNYRTWQNYGWHFYIISLLLLISVLLFGQTVRDVKSWFFIGPISIQPVELVKILVVIFLARFFSEWTDYVHGLKKMFVSGVAVFALIAFVMLQPDWGSASIIFSIWFVIILFLPLRRWQYLALIAVMVVLMVGGWQWVLQDYQRDRIISFVNPASDPLGQGYNLTQAKVAVGSGGLFGKGLTEGTQSQLRFLPEAQSDFIFAMLAEELGWVGSTTVILLFFIMYYRLFRIARNARTSFGNLMVLSILVYLFIQTGVNIGMNLGLLPITGVPLPFISAGGSSLLASFLAIGLAQSVYIHDT